MRKLFAFSQNKVQKIPAFTLAEVLITLLIIGVVAALVIPALINNTNKAEFVTKLKKEHAVLSQAFNLIALDAGGSITNNPNFNCSGTCNTGVSANAMNEFATKLNVVKNCGNGLGCFYDSALKYVGGTVNQTNVDSYWGTTYGKAILADGTMMMVWIFNANCTSNGYWGTSPANTPIYNATCGSISIDINGAAGPNQYGRDYFPFWITKTGIYPWGTYNDGASCDSNSNTWQTSAGCTGRVLTEGAINY